MTGIDQPFREGTKRVFSQFIAQVVCGAVATLRNLGYKVFAAPRAFEKPVLGG